MDWFLYDNGLRHERIKVLSKIYHRKANTGAKSIYIVDKQ